MACQVIASLQMNPRVIKVCIEREQVLYDELCSAMLEHREHEGGYVMQYSEHQEGGWTFALFMMRDTEHPSS